jgi:lysophospholipase L1-like esterase
MGWTTGRGAAQFRGMPRRLPVLTLAIMGALLAVSLPLARAAESTAVVPVPQRGQAWLNRHEGFLAEAKRGGIDLLFLGDSITDFWRDPNRGLPVWEKNYAPLHAANFGISGDRTQHLLWRLENGEVDGISPKVVVLLIGTNNTGFESDLKTPRNTTAETIQGTTLVVHTLLTKLPHAKILLLAVFPRADEKGPPPGQQIPEINAALARLADGKFVHFLDLTPKLVDDQGAVSRDLMPDLLHPNTRGYEIWAEAMREPLARLMAEAK